MKLFVSAKLCAWLEKPGKGPDGRRLTRHVENREQRRLWILASRAGSDRNTYSIAEKLLDFLVKGTIRLGRDVEVPSSFTRPTSHCSRTANMDNAYVQSPSAVLKHFDVQEASGLDKSSVIASRQQHGPNGMSFGSLYDCMNTY